ncbi:MAG: Uma2 family endonuclease [Synechococcales cyanobacterium M58_A2018_015]|nr:Uma2 family endonuclease [Synechococcales cyanobacterium M58_A2018_015]
MTQSITPASSPQSPLASTLDQEGAVVFPPGDLWSNEPPLESDFHRRQIELLIRLLEWWWRDRQDFYASGNLTIYYSPNQLKSEFFRGPDFFVVLGTEKKDRRSWAVWQEDGKYPNVIVEILSSSTASVDRNLKKQIYQDTFRTPDYFWFDPDTLELKGFHLMDGQYQELQPTPQGWLWSQQLQLYLGLWDGKLRFFTPEGELVLLPEEDLSQQAEQERQRAEQERQRAEQERQRAEAAEQELARLRALLQDSPQDNP